VIQFGLDRFLGSEAHPGARWALLANQASCTQSGVPAWEAIAERFPGRLAALLSPQHGLFTGEQANMIETGHVAEGPLGLPVHSLYSETRRPDAAWFADVDRLLVDLQDVGCRVYTFAWTLLACLEAAAEWQLPVTVLDRPNPLGTTVEGPSLDPGFESFVGGHDVPLRHGCTLGELAQRFVRERRLSVELEVVSADRDDADPERLFPHWRPPSPNLPTLGSVRVYPGQVLLEATNLSEGRGTTRPFEWLGAPFVRTRPWLAELERRALPGVRFVPFHATPTFDKWAGKACPGLLLEVTDRARFQPVETTVALLESARSLWPDDFELLPPPYEYEAEKSPLDILWGNASLRERLQN
jgi:uncharacterized protein YbbC (DUF1343 family)